MLNGSNNIWNKHAMIRKGKKEQMYKKLSASCKNP